jgi:hypothetical protein
MNTFLEQPILRAPAFGAIAATLAISAAFIIVAAILVLSPHRGQPPALSDERAWRWISSAPGASIYVSEARELSSSNYRTIWLAFRFPSNPVSVDADLIELWDVDCRQHLSRRVAGPIRTYPEQKIPPVRHSVIPAPWQPDSDQTATGKALARFCSQSG